MSQSHTLSATRRVLCVLGLTATVLAAGCAATPQVRHDQDPTVNLHAYKTFAFFDHTSNGTPGYAGLTGRNLLAATRAQMERLNYQYDERAPDLRVAVFLLVEDKVELRNSGTGRGPYGYHGWRGVESAEYRQGTLRIDVVDTRRHALVWQGVAEGRLDDKALAQPASTVQAAVADIFAQYPKRSGQ